MEKVYVIFKKNIFEEDPDSLWKIYSTREKAEKWIEEYGQWTKFIVEEYRVN